MFDSVLTDYTTRGLPGGIFIRQGGSGKGTCRTAVSFRYLSKQV
jgi:hypothetical protein